MAAPHSYPSQSFEIVGVMTGTSCDGMDAARMTITSGKTSVLSRLTLEYPTVLRKRVLSIQKPGIKLSWKDMLTLDRDLGLWYASALSSWFKKENFQPDLIANHGQTVVHLPDLKPCGITLQLGDPSLIAARTGITVASHFRSGDLASLGQGAPLAPLYHQEIAKSLLPQYQGVSIHNLGGISNFSYIQNQVCQFAFDTGPGNCWIDAATEIATRGKKKFDQGGVLGRMGKPDMVAVKKALRHPYFKKVPPKSTGRDDFTIPLFKSISKARGNDLIATAVHITAESISEAYHRFVIEKKLPLDAIVMSGGGTKNEFLISLIQEKLPTISIKNMEDIGLDSQGIEAQAFGYFGYLSLLGRSLGGKWTGAKGYAPPARLSPSQNWVSLLKKLS